MPRPELHSAERLLDAARDLLLEEGTRAATVAAIAAAAGAPKGSIYHRFGSVDDLLAALWMRAARRSQVPYVAAVAHPDPIEAAVGAALALHDFAVDHPADARLLVSLRRRDVFAADGPRAAALRELNAPLVEADRTLARRLWGHDGPEALEHVHFAVGDLPLGSLRRHLAAGRPIPPALRPRLEAAVRAALATAPVPTPSEDR